MYVKDVEMLRLLVAFALGFTIMWGVLGTKQSLGMGGSFGTYTKAYQDRQECKANPACKPKPYRRSKPRG